MSEVANIAEVANKVSEDLFKWFKWEKIPLMDEDFPCHKVGKHFGGEAEKKGHNKTHPVDVVFRYFDPYLNKTIYLNTDLKSYSVKSIKADKVRTALRSLGKSIDCAAGSSEWQSKYVMDSGTRFEVRGFLFIYNWDDEYDKNFLDLIKTIKLQDLPVRQGQFLHLFEPQRIRYISSVVSDMNHLQSRNEFPKSKYSFVYPDLFLHKAHGRPEGNSATIELLCSPYMMITHDAVSYYDEEKEEMRKKEYGGYLIYYNQSGGTEEEFVYLFDSLSRLQILSSEKTIRIRVAHHDPDEKLKSNFQKAINSYVSAWGDCSYKRECLNRIEIDLVAVKVPNYKPGILAWRS